MRRNTCSFAAALFAAFFLTAGHASAQTPSPCTAAAETNVTRGGGRAELVADFVLTCLNPSSNSFGTEAVLLVEAGQGISYSEGLRHAVIILNEAAPANQVRVALDPVNPNPSANVFVSEAAGVGPGSLVFARIPIVTGAGGRFTTRITNVRIDAANPPSAVTLVTGPGQSIRAPILFRGSNQGGAPFVSAAPVALTEVESEPFTFSVAAAAAGALQAGGVGQGSSAPLTVTITEKFAAAARKRIETTGGPEPAGAPVAQNVPGMNYYTESGFVPADQELSESGAVGVADSGTRFSVRFQTGSAEITFRVPQCVPAQGALGMELRLVTGFGADFSGGTLASSCGMTDVALESGQASLVYEVVGEPGVHGGASLDSYSIPLGAACTPNAALSQESGRIAQAGTMLVRVGPAPVRAPSSALSVGNAQAGVIPYPSFTGASFEGGVNLNAVCAAGSKPAFTSDGFTDAAAFGKPPGAGALASLFGAFGASLAVAETIPLPSELGDVSVTFENIAAAALGRKAQAAPLTAPLLFVSPGQINLQIPWEVDVSSGRVQAVVTVDGVSSDPVELPVAALSPGIFTVESGPGHAIAINPDGSLAQPGGSIPGYTTRPVAVGEALIILATGLGATTPPAVTADDSYDEQGAFVRRDTVEVPRVTIGGVEQSVAFSGMSPEFVGVNQVNIVVQPGTPAGDAQALVLQTGGLSSRGDVTIAVAGN